jgi:hypothetical protein
VWWRDYETRRNDDFLTLMQWIMQLDDKLDEILDRLEDENDDQPLE